MNDIQRRFLLFLIGCIGSRSVLVHVARTSDKESIVCYLGYLALIPAVGFFYIYMTGARKTGGEVFGERIWWNDLRPLHGFLYLLFAWYAIHRNPIAWIYLLIDVVIGLTGFLTFHYMQGNFHKLFDSTRIQRIETIQ